MFHICYTHNWKQKFKCPAWFFQTYVLCSKDKNIQVESNNLQKMFLNRNVLVAIGNISFNTFQLDLLHVNQYIHPNFLSFLSTPMILCIEMPVSRVSIVKM